MRSNRVISAAAMALLAAAALCGSSTVAAVDTDMAAQVASSAHFDKTCFELPVVIVTPINERLPTETCNQQRYPALDCMKTPVAVALEVIDHTNGSLNCLNGERTSIHNSTAHYRGQSSLHFSKHQMSVKLDTPSEFLGFPEDTKFVLNGPVIDASLLRNHLAHWLFRGTTRYSPRTRHIVVFIRDRIQDFEPAYKGIYLALEKISYGPNRVALAPLSHSCQSDKERTGGWAWQNNPLNYGVYSPNIVHDQYEALFGSGERPVLMAPAPIKLSQRLRDYFVDPATGPLPQLYQTLYNNMTNPLELEKHVDIGSFVDYFLHSEMSQNSDAYRRSAYFFKDRNQPINAGPVWDFNLAYGKGANQHDWLYKPHSFWKRLACHYKFAALVPQRWRALRKGAWSDESIQSFLGNSSAPIVRQLEHCAVWTSSNLQCANTNENNETFLANVDSLERTVLARARWIDEHVTSFFMQLNSTMCMPAGPLPLYNCAANGSDSGCLRDPEAYINAVEFPPVRQPSLQTECGSSSSSNAVASSTGTTMTVNHGVPSANASTSADEPSIDPCWLAAGVYLTEGSLTPFCSGYGTCPPGPGASCKCSSGRKLPTCARSDDPITVKPLVAAASSSGYSTVFGLPTLAVVVAALVALVGLVAGVVYRRHQRKRQSLLYPPVRTNDKPQYGT